MSVGSNSGVEGGDVPDIKGVGAGGGIGYGEGHSGGGGFTQAHLDRMLRSCVACGLCLPHCATYQASGNEALSPRGRLLLLSDFLSGRLPKDERMVAQAFDRCLGCMACTVFCPSGVSFDCFEHLRILGGEASRRRRADPTGMLARRAVLRLLRPMAGTVRRGLARLLGSDWRRRLLEAPFPLASIVWLLETLPAVPDSDSELLQFMAGLAGVDSNDPSRARTIQPERDSTRFAGDVAMLLPPGTGSRLHRLLSAHGCKAPVGMDMPCCDARGSYADTMAAQTDRLGKVTELLDQCLPPFLGPVPLRVAVHDPCHMRNERGAWEASRRLLGRIGDLEVLEPVQPELCCGGPGDYGLRHPELSQAMGRRKAEALAGTGCRLVVTTDLGCLGQIAAGLALEAPSVQVLPLTDLLWYAWSVTGPGTRV